MHRYLALVAIIATVAGAIVAMPASSTPGVTSDALQEAFPSLKGYTEKQPLDPYLPTNAAGSLAVATGKAGLAGAIELTQTDQSELCMKVQGTSTCSPASAAARGGIFVAKVQCGGVAPHIDLVGILPRGVPEVTAVDTTEPASALARSDGSVALTVNGVKLGGLHLGNGELNGLQIDGCRSRQVAQ